MRTALLGLVVGLSLLAGTAHAQTTDVLAPARQGQLQCYEPNVASKTCQSLGGYTFAANGVIDNVAWVLIMPEPVVIMRISSPVVVRNNAICGPLSAADIARATFTIQGAPAGEADTRDIRAGLTEQLAPMLNQESCLTLTADGNGFRADTTIGGVPQPQQTQRVIWIGPNDGYRVAP
ncbi:hypothetical protein [Candidatus Viadribacter manganicus]|uniref:Uncharacterized protein n=1 Tax=Candidatus Viadribacter manganicus TaxID=1759059 RepID=A0A1B1ADQ1_9PROT|nr:hypothetical protein [Candidatus Viadribacter manganicus]ANP44682.1 hypothetical protein ATE48_01465 [Candidatus Viadribacter manganicus]